MPEMAAHSPFLSAHHRKKSTLPHAFCKRLKVKVNGYLSGNRGSLLLRYALKGLGITQQSNHPMCNLVRQKKLLAVPGGWSRWSVTWYALSRTRTSTVPKIQVLIEFLKERFAQPDKINSF